MGTRGDGLPPAGQGVLYIAYSHGCHFWTPEMALEAGKVCPPIAGRGACQGPPRPER